MTEIQTNILENEDTMEGRYLVFSIDNESYGIEIRF